MSYGAVAGNTGNRDDGSRASCGTGRCCTMGSWAALAVAALVGYGLGNLAPWPSTQSPKSVVSSSSESSPPVASLPQRPASSPASSPVWSTVEVPGELSDDAIQSLSKAESQALLGAISRARQNPTLDDATRRRLKDDFGRVLARAKAAP